MGAAVAPLHMAVMTELAAEAVFAGYRMFGLAVRPFVPVILSRRVARGREDEARSSERYGTALLPRPPGRVVWVHAVSVGETNAVLPLIGRLTGRGFGVVLTTTTVTSATVAGRRLPAGAVHQFSPLDIGVFIDRFLDHWRPELAVFVESELWPVTIRRTAASVPVVIVNGRLSERSYRSWRRFTPVARLLLANVRLCLARTDRDGERYAALGARDVEVTGNLKFDAPAPDVDRRALDRLRAGFGGRPVWIAASTHEGEEATIADAHRRLRDAHPGVLTIIAPRHPDRGHAIREDLTAKGFHVAQRSRNEPPGGDSDIYLADTLGELELFYRAAPIAFVGGSLVAHGGQNPIEPIRAGATVIHGPHVHNFDEVYGMIDAVAPVPVVTDAVALAETVGRLLAAPEEAARLAAAAEAEFARHAGALDATMVALERFLGGTGVDAEGA